MQPLRGILSLDTHTLCASFRMLSYETHPGHPSAAKDGRVHTRSEATRHLYLEGICQSTDWQQPRHERSGGPNLPRPPHHTEDPSVATSLPP